MRVMGGALRPAEPVVLLDHLLLGTTCSDPTLACIEPSVVGVMDRLGCLAEEVKSQYILIDVLSFGTGEVPLGSVSLWVLALTWSTDMSAMLGVRRVDVELITLPTGVEHVADHCAYVRGGSVEGGTRQNVTADVAPLTSPTVSLSRRSVTVLDVKCIARGHRGVHVIREDGGLGEGRTCDSVVGEDTVAIASNHFGIRDGHDSVPCRNGVLY